MLSQAMVFDLKQTLVILARSPNVLRALLYQLPEEWTQKNYGSNTWSAHEVLGHLIWGERTDWIPRVRHILAAGDSVPFEPFDRNGHISLCQERNTNDLIDVFANERSANLDELTALSLTPALFVASVVVMFMAPPSASMRILIVLSLSTLALYIETMLRRLDEVAYVAATCCLLITFCYYMFITSLNAAISV